MVGQCKDARKTSPTYLPSMAKGIRSAHISPRLTMYVTTVLSLLPFGSSVQFRYLLQRYSLATRDKWKRDACSALCGNDSRPNSFLTHTISRDPHEKRRKLLTADDVSLPSHAPAILTFWRTTRNVREFPVKVPEMWKRSACYHSLRKALAPRRAHIKKRGSRTIYAEKPASSDSYSHRHARTPFWHPRSFGRHAAGAH